MTPSMCGDRLVMDIQVSLRDTMKSGATVPASELAGYFHPSLRDFLRRLFKNHVQAVDRRL
jgi:hypothetical protein